MKYTMKIFNLKNHVFKQKVRTPIGLVNGSLQQATDLYLSEVALREACCRARVPQEDIQKIFLGCVGQNHLTEICSDKLLQSAGLANKIPLTLVPCGLQSVILASEYLSKVDEGVCVAGGVESMSNNFVKKIGPQQIFPSDIRDKEEELEKEYLDFNKEERNAYILQDHENLQNIITTKPFEDEMIRIILSIQGKRKVLREDDKVREFKNLLEKTKKLENRFASVPGDGASVLIVATKNYLKKNQLTPLAKIISVANDSLNTSDFLSTKTINNALFYGHCEPNEILQWEIDDYFCDLALSVIKNYNINPTLLNKDGGTLTLGHPIGMSGARLICHLAHSLESGKLGCASSNNPYGVSSSVIIKKIDTEKNSKPKIVMYTKATCPMCDTMKDQLKSYSDKFDLEEVDIEKKGNEKFLKMYGWEIPVLFLNGRYLCKHTLNVEHLRRRLLELEKITKKTE